MRKEEETLYLEAKHRLDLGCRRGVTVRRKVRRGEVKRRMGRPQAQYFAWVPGKSCVYAHFEDPRNRAGLGEGDFLCVFFFPLENRTPLFPEDTTVSQLPSIRCLPFTGRRQGLRGMGSPSPSGLDLKPCLLLPSHSLPPLGPATICSPEGEFSPRPEVCLVIHCQTAKWRY